MSPTPHILESARPDPEYLRVAKGAMLPPLPPNIHNMTTLREKINDLKSKTRDSLDITPIGLTERDIKIPVQNGGEVLAYVYAPSEAASTEALPILLFFHGGGFCIGSRHDDLESNRAIAIRARVIIISLEYSLAPEHPFPQAINDGLDALNWINQNASRIHPSASPSAGLIVGGTSAGGNIAQAVVYQNRDDGSPIKVTGQLLSVAPLLPPSVVPEKYRDDYVSHEQNKNVAIPSKDLTKMFLDPIQALCSLYRQYTLQDIQEFLPLTFKFAA